MMQQNRNGVERFKNDMKYRNARGTLLAIIAFSALNFILISFAETYFLFSSYLTQLITAFGAAFTEELQDSIWLILAGILVVLCLIPYLLCWIFSKKHAGWMVAAAILFSLDTLLLVGGMMWGGEFEPSFLIDLVFHALALYPLISGAVYGLKMNKEEAECPAAEEAETSATSSEGTLSELFETKRTLTLQREKKFVGSLMMCYCFINDQQVCELKNGETKSVQITEKACTLRLVLAAANGANASESEPVSIEANSNGDPLSYKITAKEHILKGFYMLVERI